MLFHPQPRRYGKHILSSTSVVSSVSGRTSQKTQPFSEIVAMQFDVTGNHDNYGVTQSLTSSAFIKSRKPTACSVIYLQRLLKLTGNPDTFWKSNKKLKFWCRNFRHYVPVVFLRPSLVWALFCKSCLRKSPYQVTCLLIS